MKPAPGDPLCGSRDGPAGPWTVPGPEKTFLPTIFRGPDNRRGNLRARRVPASVGLWPNRTKAAAESDGRFCRGLGALFSPPAASMGHGSFPPPATNGRLPWQSARNPALESAIIVVRVGRRAPDCGPNCSCPINDAMIVVLARSWGPDRYGGGPLRSNGPAPAVFYFVEVLAVNRLRCPVSRGHRPAPAIDQPLVASPR